MGSVIWRIVLALVAIVAMAYAEQFFPGVGLVVVCLLVPIGLLWNKFTDEFHERDGVLLFVLGICFVVLSIVNTQVIGVKVAADGRNGAKLVSSFYPFGRVLAEGDSIDTVNVAWRYREDDGTYFAERRDCYIVRRGKMTSVFRGYDRIVDEGRDLRIGRRDMGHGMLNTIIFTDSTGSVREVDMYGDDVLQPDYSPPTNEVTEPVYVPSPYV